MFAKLRALLMIPESEPLDYPFVASDIARLAAVRADPARQALDDASWKDLLLDACSARLSGEVSIFGQQLLHQRLREGLGDADCAALGERVRALMADPAQIDTLRRHCLPLRRAEREVASLLFDAAAPPPKPWWIGKHWIMPLLLLGAIGLVIVTPLAWLATFAIAFVLMSTQMRYYERTEAWERNLHALQMLLRATSLLGGDDAAAAGKLNRALSRGAGLMATPGARTYADWFMLDNVNHYYRSLHLVHGQRDFLRACYLNMAGLEADVALARYLLQAPVFCWASRHGAALELEAMVHPLLDQAQALDLQLGAKGAFVSGQNGIGKSTLLRALGLNLVLARAFGFCHAARAVLPDLPVHTSMQSEDSLFGGESLYMAELRRAQELLAAPPGICIIDEIFRGTNHLESVSAAASVLDSLAERGPVIVSSHNLVLAPLLAHRLDPLCVSAAADGTLSLAPGVLAHTNGIALLARRGFGADIETKAGKVFDWLSGYLAHPGDCTVLAGGDAGVDVGANAGFDAGVSAGLDTGTLASAAPTLVP